MKKICPCGEKSVPGLITGIALCQRHFNALVHESGTEHDRNEALQYFGQQRGALPHVCCLMHAFLGSKRK